MLNFFIYRQKIKYLLKKAMIRMYHLLMIKKTMKVISI